MSFYGLGRESRMIEEAIEAGGMAWWFMELPSGAVFFSPNKITMLGYGKDEASKFVHYSAFTDLLHPEDYEKTMQAMKKLIDGKAELYQAKYRIRKADGGYMTLYDRGRIVARKGDEIAIAGIVLDMTSYFPETQKDYVPQKAGATRLSV